MLTRVMEIVSLKTAPDAARQVSGPRVRRCPTSIIK